MLTPEELDKVEQVKDRLQGKGNTALCQVCKTPCHNGLYIWDCRNCKAECVNRNQLDRDLNKAENMRKAKQK